MPPINYFILKTIITLLLCDSLSLTGNNVLQVFEFTLHVNFTYLFVFLNSNILHQNIFHSYFINPQVMVIKFLGYLYARATSTQNEFDFQKLIWKLFSKFWLQGFVSHFQYWQEEEQWILYELIFV